MTPMLRPPPLGQSELAATRPIWAVVLPVVAVVAIAAVTLGHPTGPTLPAALDGWLAVWLAIVIQALPFLVLGVLVSGAIAAFVPRDLLRRLVPRDPAGAVFAAGLFSTVLPGCECASVPVARTLLRTGLPPAASFTFLLAAPAVNPVVLVATAVAYAGHPMMVIARFVASMLTAWIVGWLWIRFGRDHWIATSAQQPEVPGPRAETFRRTATHDLLHAGGFLVLGGAVAAAINVLLPQRVLAGLAAHPVLSVLALAMLAVTVSICSEADAFVAASLTSFSPLAQLVFMTVSPMVDLKLISMQAGTFGSSFAVRFAPATFAVAVFVAAGIGVWAL